MSTTPPSGSPSSDDLHPSSPPDLTLVGTADLLEQLQTRFTHMVLLAQMPAPVGPQFEALVIHHSGDLMAALGLLRTAACRIEAQVVAPIWLLGNLQAPPSPDSDPNASGGPPG